MGAAEGAAAGARGATGAVADPGIGFGVPVSSAMDRTWVVHWVPSKKRSDSGVPAGSGYQPGCGISPLKVESLGV